MSIRRLPDGTIQADTPKELLEYEALLEGAPTSMRTPTTGAGPRRQSKQRNIAPETFTKNAPRLVESLLHGNVDLGKLTTTLTKDLGMKESTFRVLLLKLIAETSFISKTDAGRGQAPFVRITDVEAARKWLAEHIVDLAAKPANTA